MIQEVSGDCDIIKVDHTPLRFLCLFVALTGDDHGVVSIRELQGQSDGGASVNFDSDIRRAFRTVSDLVGDCYGVLAPWIVAGDNRDLGMTARDTPHDRPLFSVAITAAAGTLASANYAFTVSDGTLTVTKAPLSVNAADAGKTYGDVDPALAATLSGFRNGQNAGTAGISGAASCSRVARMGFNR